MKRLSALVLALPFVLFAAGPTAAYQVISEVGPHGEVWLDDSMATPAGTCKYGDVVYSNWAYLEWMKIKAPHVFAADRNSDKRDHRVVSWQWKLQRLGTNATKWKTIKESGIQKKTAYEDQQAAFTPMTINYMAVNEDPNHNVSADVKFRGLVIIKWYKNDGSVESTVKLVPDWYKIRTYWDASPQGNGYCARFNTDG